MKYYRKSGENMKDTAIRLCMEDEQKRKTDPIETYERSIIVLGSKGVGKTTMIYRFLEKDETPRPTVAMDYSFGRKAGKSLVKNIVHVWDVGYLTSVLVSAAMTGSILTHSPHHTTLLIMLDLTQPEVMWSSFEEILSILRSALKMSYSVETIQELKNKRMKERKKDLEKGVDPFPLKMCIIGGKYDEFKEFDIDKKEVIAKTLRVMAHSLDASLQYHSIKDKTLMKRTKDLLFHCGFGGPSIEGKCTDFEKPLAVPAGSDSFAQIDLQFLQTRPSVILDTIKQIYVSRIPQISRNDASTAEDPSNDSNFNEPVIDRLRTQREEEIGVLLHDMLEGHVPQIPIPDPF